MRLHRPNAVEWDATRVPPRCDGEGLFVSWRIDPPIHFRTLRPVRLFHVSAAHLPTKLLVSQHRTIHLLLAACAKGSGTGGLAHYLNHAGFLAAMHHDCVRELRMRGGSHASPILDDWKRVYPVRRKISLSIPPARLAVDVMDLDAKIRSRSGLLDARLPLKCAPSSLSLLFSSIREIPEAWLHE